MDIRRSRWLRLSDAIDPTRTMLSIGRTRWRTVIPCDHLSFDIATYEVM